MRLERVCIVGMGYVGLTLSVVLAERGFRVSGVEIQQEIVKVLQEGQPHFHEPGLLHLFRRHLNENLRVSDTIPSEPQDAFIIAVGTPIDHQSRVPLLDVVIRATNQVAPYLREGNLVILRSTVPVGTSRQVVLPLLQRKVRNILLAYCPERTAEGVALRELRELPQIIGGLDEESVEKAQEIFRKVTYTTIEVSSLEAAEMIKLLDNSYRDLTFAFANEIALFCERLGLDASELIRAANMGYPRTNIPVPGFVGGACLRKDPYILIHSLRDVEYDPALVRESRRINESLPKHAVARMLDNLRRVGKDVKDAKILIAGLAFKGQPETDDLRGSPALVVIELLRSYTSNIYGHDFVVLSQEIAKLGIISCNLEEGFRGADGVIFMNNHRSYYDLDIAYLTSLMRKPAVFVDGWHIYDPKTMRSLDGLLYSGIGVG